MQAMDGAVDEPPEDGPGIGGDGEVQGHLGLPGGAAPRRHCRSWHLHTHQALINGSVSGSTHHAWSRQVNGHLYLRAWPCLWAHGLIAK
jgi:hypothetical protein